MFRLLFAALLTLGLTAACIVVPGAHLHPRHPVLVGVAPGVWVVEDYPTAVFFSHDYYWYYEGGLWYRSTHYSGGWVQVRVDVVPAPVVKLDRTRYVRYRAPADARRRDLDPRRVEESPGRRGTPPGHGGTPPGHGGTPPGHSKGKGKGKKKKW